MKRLGFGIMALLLAGTVTIAAEVTEGLTTKRAEEMTSTTETTSISMEELDKRVEEKVQNMLAKNDSFEIHGYGRVGVLANQDGKQVTGGIPNKNIVGRLGNETDNYWELEFVKKFTADNGVWSNWHLMFAQHDKNRDRLNDGSGTADVSVRQLYAEMGGFNWNPNLTYWVGKRFYNRQDIYITDYYWNDYSGTGAGVQGLVDGNLDLAYVAGSSWEDDLLTVDGKLMSHNFIGTYRYNSWTFDAMAMFANDNDTTGIGKTDDTADSGVQGNVVYGGLDFYGISDGFSKTYFQAGYGLGSTNGLGHTQWNWTTNQKDISYRLGTYGVTDGEKWAIMPETFVQYDVIDATSDNNKLTFSAAVRPVYKVVDNFIVQFELGLGYEGYNKNENTNGNKRNGFTYKATVAPTLTMNDSFWGRPQLRVFGSYVGWSSDVAPKDDKAYAGSDGELRVGVQAEVWF